MPRDLKIPIRWAKIPAAGNGTTTVPVLHNSSAVAHLELSSSCFSFSHVVCSPNIASLNSCSGWSNAGFTVYTGADYQNLPDLRRAARSQIYALLPRRIAGFEQVGKFQIER